MPLFNRFYRLVILLPTGWMTASIHFFSWWNPWGARFDFRSAHYVLINLGLPKSYIIISVAEISKAEHQWLEAGYNAARQQRVSELRPSDTPH